MKLKLSIVIAVCFISFVGFTSSLLAQVEDVSKWLSRDTAGLVYADDVSALAERIREFPLFQDAAFLEAMELATNESNPLIHPSKLDDLNSCFDRLTDSDSGIQQILLVVHSVSKEEMQFSVLVKVQEEKVSRVSKQIVDAFNLLNGIDSDSETLEAKIGELSENCEKIGYQNFVGSELGNWIAFGNHEAEQLDILKRMKGGNVGKTLAEARVFLGTRNRLLGKWSGDGLVYVFLRPAGLRSFFPSFSDKYWKALSVDELPGASIQIAIRDENPYIVANGIVNHTQPASGLAKQYRAYCEIESFPSVPYPIIEFSAETRDPQLRFEATESVYDGTNGKGAYAKHLEKTYAKDDRDFFKDILPRIKSRFTFRYYPRAINTPEDAPQLPNENRPHVVLFEEVADYDAMMRFVLGAVKNQNRYRKGTEIRELDIDGRENFLIWAQTDEDLYKQYKKSYPNGKVPREAINFKTVKNVAFALSEDWYIQGNLAEILEMIKSTSGLQDADAMKDILNEVRTIENELGFKRKSVKIERVSSNTFEDPVRKLMDRHLASKFPGYSYGTAPPAGLTQLRSDLAKGEYVADLNDPKDVLETFKYLMMKSLINTLDQKTTLVSLEDSSVQIGIAISGKQPDP